MLGASTHLVRTFSQAAFVCLTLVVASCAPPQEPSRSFAMGLTYWPPLGPATDESEIQRDLAFVLANADLLHVQVPWCPSNLQTLDDLAWIPAVSRSARRRLAVSIDWLEPDRNGKRCEQERDWRFGDAASRSAFQDVAVRIAADHTPDYLLLGVEVDFYSVVNPADFESFLKLYAETRQAVHQVSNATTVTVSFQYEHASRTAGTSGSLLDDMLVAFGPSLDILGLSLYPFLAGATPQDIGRDYLAPLATMDRNIAVFETGWPGGDDSELAAQREYLRHLMVAMDTLAPRALIWVSAVDADPTALPPGVPSWASHAGLSRRLGRPKPAAAVWSQWFSRRWQP